MSTADVTQRLQWRDSAPLFLMSGSHGSLHWVLAVFYILLPSIKDQYGLSYVQVGFVGSVINISSLAMNLPSGIFVDLTGRRRACQLTALVFCGLALIGVGSSTSFWLLIVCAAFVSMMNTLWHPAAISYLSQIFPDRRGLALSFHTVGASIGDAAGYVVAGVVAGLIGWQNTAMLAGAVPILAGFILFLTFIGNGEARPHGRRSGARSYLVGLLDLMKQAHTWKVLLVSGFRGTSQNGLRLYMPLYVAPFFAGSAVSLPGIGANWSGGLAAAGFVMAIWQFSGGLATPFAGIASDRLGRKPVLMLGFAGSALILLALPSVASPTLFMALIALAGIFVFAVRPVIQSWALDETPPQLGGSMVSLQFAAMAAFGAGIPPVAGWIADVWGLPSVFYFLAAMVLVATVIATTVGNTSPAKAAA